MELADRFWGEYKSRFGEPELPMPDLGMGLITIRMEKDDVTEELEIGGGGYMWNHHQSGSGLSRVKLILDELDKYNITGRIVRQKW